MTAVTGGVGSGDLTIIAADVMDHGALRMERRRLMPVALLLFIIGAAALSRFSHDVRGVAVVGLSGAGCAIGMGFALLAFGPAGLKR